MLYRMKELLKTLFRKFRYTKSFSQFGEDAIIQTVFKEKKGKGIYVDIGAYHPILYSNTYALYLKGWCGLSIDPNPTLQKLHSIFRRRDTFINAAVGTTNNMNTYFMFSDGAYNTMDKSVAEDLKRKTYPSFIGTMDVPTLSLKKIVEEHALTNIDFMNIDVEGKDLEVLQSYNWIIKPIVISIENSHSKIKSLLSEKGYEQIANVGISSIYKLNQ